MVNRHFLVIVGILTISVWVIACSDDESDSNGGGFGGSGQQGGQDFIDTGGSAIIPGTGGVGVIEPLAGAGGNESAAGTGGTGPAAGTGGTAPIAGTGGTGPAAGTGGTAPIAGTGGTGPVEGTGGTGPVAGSGGTEPVAGTGGAGPAPGIVCTGEQVPVNGQCVDRKLPEDLGPGWVQINPGPPTTCIYGDPYSFYVRKGTVNKVMLFLQGGGACWDAASCLLPIYSQTVMGPPGTSGIMDPNNAENPFKDWYVVYAPYCTGDVFFGDVTQDWGGGPVEYKGFVNVNVIRDWITENITSPEFFFVSGASAGAVGVTLQGAYLIWAYKDNPEVDGAMVTDSYQAIIPDNFVGIENWNASANFPDWLPELKSVQPPYPGDIMKRGIEEALALPELSRYVAANFNYADDGVQALFYGFMGGTGDVGGMIAQTVHELAASSPNNYRFYLTPGSSHTVFEMDAVYTLTTGGVRLIDWLRDIVNNVDVANVE